MGFEEVQRTWEKVAGSSEPLLIRASGGSMQPLAAPGTIFSVLRADPGKIRIGDIVVARVGDRLIAHRLVRRRGNLLILRGDARDYDDAPISSEQVLGRAVSLSRGGWTIDLDSRWARGLGIALVHVPGLGRIATAARTVARRFTIEFLGTGPGRFFRRGRGDLIEIRLAGPSDKAQYRLLRLGIGSPWWLPDELSLGGLWVAVADGRVVGCGWLREDQSCGAYVRPMWRRLGIGRRLLTAAIEPSAGAPQGRAPPADLALARLYESVCFKQIGPELWTRGS